MADANTVLYKGIKNIDVIKQTEQYSIARFDYYGKRRYGIRWNGGENSVGTPSSHGKPTWFILPDEIVAVNIKIKI